MKVIHRIIPVLASYLASAGAQAQTVTVVDIDTSSTIFTDSTAPYTVSFAGPSGGPHTYRVLATSTVDIASISVGPFTGSLVLEIDVPSGTATIGNVGPITKSGSNGNLIVRANVLGNLQEITADGIDSVTTQAKITGSLISGGAITGSIRAKNGIEADIIAGGAIADVLTGDTNGQNVTHIGTTTNVVHIEAKGSIGLIRASNLFARIDADTTDGDADGTIDSLDVRGNFAGGTRGGVTTPSLIKCARFVQNVAMIDGNVASNASILLGEQFGSVDLDDGSQDACAGDEQIRIGGSLAGSITVLESAGLAGGQIVINALNTGGTWSGDVKVGPVGSQITLASQTYAETACTPVSLSCDVGCGSVGRVPYFVHDSSCTPAHNGTGTPCNVLMRFYGPVEWDTEEQSFTLERRQAGSSTCGGGTWCTVSCADFKGCCIDNVNGFGTRNVTFTGYTFQHGFQYRIKPARTGVGTVTCDLGGGAPVVTVPDDEFVFTLINPCPPDLNCDGCVDGADLSVLLSSFGETDTGCGVGGDTNADGQCSGADLSGVLGSFGTNCVEECEGSEGFARGGDSEIGLLAINAFGHNDFSEYATWVDSMDTEEFADHAIVLQAVLEALLNDE